MDLPLTEDAFDYMGLNRRAPIEHFPEKPALLVIDMQNYFVHEEGKAFLPDSRGILQNISDLTGLFNEKRLPVIFTRHVHSKKNPGKAMEEWWDDLIMENTWQSEILSDFSHNEKVIEKNRYSSFIGTGLKERLNVMGCDGVVITGVMTHLCVETTARESFMKDLRTVVVGDACASVNWDHHLHSLKNLAHGFALVLTTEKVMELMK